MVGIGADGRSTVFASGLSVPEGLAPAPGGGLYVIEQKLNRLDRISASGAVSPIHSFANGTGRDGIDSIRLEDGGRILVPDSPNGNLLEYDPATDRVTVIATGLGRPVDATPWTTPAGLAMIAVADEFKGLLLVDRATGTVTVAASLALADDVEVGSDGNLIVSGLQDGRVHLYRDGHLETLASGFKEPQGLALLADGSLLVADTPTGIVFRLTAPCLHR